MTPLGSAASLATSTEMAATAPGVPAARPRTQGGRGQLQVRSARAGAATRKSSPRPARPPALVLICVGVPFGESTVQIKHPPATWRDHNRGAQPAVPNRQADPRPADANDLSKFSLGYEATHITYPQYFVLSGSYLALAQDRGRETPAGKRARKNLSFSIRCAGARPRLRCVSPPTARRQPSCVSSKRNSGGAVSIAPVPLRRLAAKR